MSDTKLYSMAERMGFWASLMDKLRGKKPEGKTSKEREMIAVDDAIQPKLESLDAFMFAANSSFQYGDLQETYNHLFNYDATLQGVVSDAGTLIGFGEKHKIAYSRKGMLVKLADLDDKVIEVYKSHIKKFFTDTAFSSLRKVKSLMTDLSQAREKGNVTSYISILRKFKSEADDFNEKLAKLNENVIVRHKKILDKKHLESKDVLSKTIQDMRKELIEGRKPLPDVNLPVPSRSITDENIESKLQESAKYISMISPAQEDMYVPKPTAPGTILTMDQVMEQLKQRPDYGTNTPAARINHISEDELSEINSGFDDVVASRQHKKLISLASRVSNKYGG